MDILGKHTCNCLDTVAPCFHVYQADLEPGCRSLREVKGKEVGQATVMKTHPAQHDLVIGLGDLLDLCGHGILPVLDDSPASEARGSLRHPSDRRPLRFVLLLMLEDHPDRPFPHLGGTLLRFSHDSILSRFGVFGNPGAIQGRTRPSLRSTRHLSWDKLTGSFVLPPA